MMLKINEEKYNNAKAIYYAEVIKTARENRINAQISQREIAESLGVTSSAISHFECGQNDSAIIEHEYRKRGLL